jgi:serine protease
MKKYLYYSLIILSLASCRRDELNTVVVSSPVLQYKTNIAREPFDLFSEQEVKNAVVNSLEKGKDFKWIDADLKMICSGAKITKLISVGYKPAGFSKDVNDVIHEINIHDLEWIAVHDELINSVRRLLNEQGANDPNLIYEDDPVLPLIIFRTDNAMVITNLFNLKNVRYIEPYGFWPYPQSCSSSGCAGAGGIVSSADYFTIQPACLLPWNFGRMNIPAAWTNSTGNGIGIGIIDAGISNVQSLLSNQFTSGYSNNGRTVSLDYSFGNSAYSSCTHGTSMCGLAAGPRNNYYAPTGVAYRSSLTFIRGCNDVLLDASDELSGVKNALVKLGNNASVKIISMSVGTPLYSSTLLDGVTYAYGKGKLIFAAAGTSFNITSWWGVIYPAAYAQCNAVTGIKENGNRCSNCHDGSQVKFTITMERDIDDSRDGVTISYNNLLPDYIGGSSCATATCAGIAALVWSVNPLLTRTQVYDCMRQTAQYPVPVTNKGFGNPNAAAAVMLAATL